MPNTSNKVFNSNAYRYFMPSILWARFCWLTIPFGSVVGHQSFAYQWPVTLPKTHNLVSHCKWLSDSSTFPMWTNYKRRSACQSIRISLLKLRPIDGINYQFVLQTWFSFCETDSAMQTTACAITHMISRCNNHRCFIAASFVIHSVWRLYLVIYGRCNLCGTL